MAEQLKATFLKKGMYIKLNGGIYSIMSLAHVTPGKGHGMVQSKLRNIVAGNQMEHRFRSDETVERAFMVWGDVRGTVRNPASPVRRAGEMARVCEGRRGHA